MTVLGGGAVSYERGTPVARVKCVSRMYGVARERDTCERRMKSKTSAIDKYIAALEETQGQMDGFFSQLSYKCHQNRVASVGD